MPFIRSRRSFNAPESEVTPKALYLDRRRFMQVAGGAVAATLIPDAAMAALGTGPWADVPNNAAFSTDEEPTAYQSVTTYNNFYEFGVDKSDPAENAKLMVTDPWTVTVDGECDAGGVFDFDALVRPHDYEERIYRLRCVEAWSMVIPWIGFPLARLIERARPTSKARFVRFETLYDPAQMPGTRLGILEWPYREGLRLDEAMNPLSFIAAGLYGEPMPNQNGAPLRLVVPWKYGFKSIKSIVRITLTEDMPATSWNISAPNEYGFYANVNPQVDHPRWSQARERRIGDFLKRDTLMFNGYGEWVADLYKGMDLAKHY